MQKEITDQGYKFGIVEATSFTSLTKKKEDGTEKELSQDDSVKIHKILTDKGYIDKNKATSQFFIDKQNGDFTTSEEYAEFDKFIASTIEKLSRDCMPKNAKERVKVNRNDKVINSEVFNEIWTKINQKTIVKNRNFNDSIPYKLCYLFMNIKMLIDNYKSIIIS